MEGEPRAPLAIGNVCLLALGQEAIASWDDTSDAVDRVKAIIDTETEIVLRMSRWKFGRFLRSISPATDLDPDSFSAAYPLPDNVVRIWNVTGCSAWERRGTYLVANASGDVDVEGNIWPDAEAQWPAELVKLAGLACAHFLIDKFGISEAQAQRIERAMRKAESRAKFINASEGSPTKAEPMDFISARY